MLLTYLIISSRPISCLKKGQKSRMVAYSRWTQISTAFLRPASSSLYKLCATFLTSPKKPVLPLPYLRRCSSTSNCLDPNSSPSWLLPFSPTYPVQQQIHLDLPLLSGPLLSQTKPGHGSREPGVPQWPSPRGLFYAHGRRHNL